MFASGEVFQLLQAIFTSYDQKCAWGNIVFLFAQC